jgi:hypothetical protein
VNRRLRRSSGYAAGASVSVVLTAALLLALAVAQPTFASSSTCSLISKSTFATSVGLPHVREGELSREQTCEYEAWRGGRPRTSNEILAGVNNRTYADVEVFSDTQDSQQGFESLLREWLSSREGREITELGGRHEAFQPPLLGMESARGHQAIGRASYIKATWWSAGSRRLVYVNLFAGGRSSAQQRSLLKRIAAIVIPAALSAAPSKAS